MKKKFLVPKQGSKSIFEINCYHVHDHLLFLLVKIEKNQSLQLWFEMRVEIFWQGFRQKV